MYTWPRHFQPKFFFQLNLQKMQQMQKFCVYRPYVVGRPWVFVSTSHPSLTLHPVSPCSTSAKILREWLKRTRPWRGAGSRCRWKNHEQSVCCVDGGRILCCWFWYSGRGRRSCVHWLRSRGTRRWLLGIWPPRLPSWIRKRTCRCWLRDRSRGTGRGLLRRRHYGYALVELGDGDCGGLRHEGNCEREPEESICENEPWETRCQTAAGSEQSCEECEDGEDKTH